MKKLLPILLILQIFCIASFAQEKKPTKQEVMDWIGINYLNATKQVWYDPGNERCYPNRVAQIISDYSANVINVRLNVVTGMAKGKNVKCSFRGKTDYSIRAYIYLDRISEVSQYQNNIVIKGSRVVCYVKETDPEKCTDSWELQTVDRNVKPDLHAEMTTKVKLLAGYNAGSPQLPVEKVAVATEPLQRDSQQMYVQRDFPVKKNQEAEASLEPITVYGGWATFQLIGFYIKDDGERVETGRTEITEFADHCYETESEAKDYIKYGLVENTVMKFNNGLWSLGTNFYNNRYYEFDRDSIRFELTESKSLPDRAKQKCKDAQTKLEEERQTLQEEQENIREKEEEKELQRRKAVQRKQMIENAGKILQTIINKGKKKP